VGSREIDSRFASTYFSYPGMESTTDDFVFLANRSKEDWARLVAQGELLRFEAGDVILQAGEIERSLYIIVQGTLEVLLPFGRGEFRHYGTIESRSVTGEIAFLDGRPRTATIRALTETVLLRITFESYEVLAARFPELGRAILLDLGRILAAKLRLATELITRMGG
jgi:SulP family sulfate permease